MVSNKCRLSRRARAGSTVVELALTLPMFLTMGVGTLECGRALMVQQMIVNASREGARHGSLPGAKTEEVKTKTKDFLATGNVDRTKVAVTVFVNGVEDSTGLLLPAAQTGATVDIRIQVSYSDVAWLPTPWFLKNVSLANKTVMRRE